MKTIGAPSSLASSAFRFVLTMGVVNLFADATYEGGASINGQLLGTLGASAAAISITAGLGEFLGYSLRSVAGYFADNIGRHWLITVIGYNLLAVPAMALAPSWQAAAAFILAERVGRAIRKPTVNARRYGNRESLDIRIDNIDHSRLGSISALLANGTYRGVLKYDWSHAWPGRRRWKGL